MMVSRKPRVLWFTNTPSSAAAYLQLPTIGGGWINSLEEKLKETGDIDLAVAFRHGHEKLNKFIYQDTTYYAIPDTTSKIDRYISRHLMRIDNKELVKYCLEIVADFKPDIINIFGTEDGFGLIANQVNVPVIVHIQGILTVYELKWFSGNVSKADLARYSNVKSFIQATSLLHNYHYIKSAASREREIFKINSFFFGRTDWDRRVTAVLSPLAQYHVSNELLRKEFYQAEWVSTQRGKKRFISTIQANIYKGLETILEAALLLKQLNRFEFEWYIVGIPVDSILIRIYEDKVGKKFSDGGIVFVGRVEAAALRDLEMNADIFIHPSHIDNSPNSVCEAMLLGMPVIATYAGGTGSLLENKKEGLLIQDGDPYSLAGSVIELAENPDFAQSLGAKARQRALERHNPDTIVRNVVEVYKTVIAQHSNSVPSNTFSS